MKSLFCTKVMESKAGSIAVATLAVALAACIAIKRKRE